MSDDKPEAKPKSAISIQPGTAPEKVLDIILAKEEIIPWEPCTLPSRGAYYLDKDGNERIPGGAVQVRAFGIYADKILATARLARTGKSLDWLFRKCVQLPEGFDPLDLLAGDRIFLLYYLRGITYGNDYEFLVTCSNTECGQQSGPHNYDLNDLSKTIKAPDSSLGREPFRIVLPYLSEYVGVEFWVKVRLLRGSDTQNMIFRRNVSNVLKPKAPRARTDASQLVPSMNESIDDTVSQNLNLVIEEVMGSKDRAKIGQLVEKLHSRDTATIREFLREMSPGVETQIIVTCTHCGNEMTVDLPITESFFRPARHARIRT
jgi:hypothetical protein